MPILIKGKNNIVKDEKTSYTCKNQMGVALLMVMGSIALMAFLLADLTFETQLNQIRVYNLQDKLQARLNAEAGLNFALAKLKLYQDAYNIIENNKNLQGVIKPSQLESLITQPFFLPIPEPRGASAGQKNILAEFQENVVIKGKLNITMTPVSGFLNPNNMRVERKVEETNNPSDEDFNSNNQSNSQNQDDQNKKSPQKLIEEELVNAITQSMEQKKETDEDFDDTYGNLDPNLLVKEIKFYVNSPNDFTDSERAEIEAQYLANNITPKHAPMTSVNEMYQLLGWPDAMVDLIKDRLTVHEVSIIPANEITEAQMKVIFPEISEKQLEDFFTLRDGDPEKEIEPQEFTGIEDFKKALVESLGIVGNEEFDKRMKELESAGLKIGTAGKLFKIESTGEYERAKYSIVAFIDLPIKPQPPKKKKNPRSRRNTGISDEGETPEDDRLDEERPNDNDKKQKEEKPKTELLEPRVIELRIN